MEEATRSRRMGARAVVTASPHYNPTEGPSGRYVDAHCCLLPPAVTVYWQRQRTGQGRPTKPDPWLAGTAPACTTALAMSRDKTRPGKLSFGCPNLDAAFHGGVSVHGITEIAGEAGTGKTQLCLQLLLQAQLAPEAGGLGGKSYVLTCGEGVFPSRRLRQMADRYKDRQGVDPAIIMEGVCIQSAKNLDDQMKILMEHLPLLMEAHNIRLVVVDSIAALFRSDLGGGKGATVERSRLLGQLSQQMKRLSDRHHAAFVVVNQVTANFSSAIGGRGGGVGAAEERQGDRNVPAMGLMWSQCINSRFIVRKRDSRLPLQSSPRGSGGGGGGGDGDGSTSCRESSFRSSSPSVFDESERGARSTTGNATGNAIPTILPSGASGGGDGGGPSKNSADGGGGGGGGGGVIGGGGARRTGFARELTLEMSPCLPVRTACAFVIERDGISGL
eukprot:jgi/Undpi1/9646/HiC_scaffold_27.g12102.m1